MGFRQLAEHWACAAGLYQPLRDAYQRTLNRGQWARRLHLEHFTGRFVQAGDLVFDVGANQGRWTEVYQRLGARVVAIEPNPELARRIRRRYRPYAVEACALAAEPGEATLYLGRHSGHSTLSRSWMERVQKLDPGLQRWEGEVQVPVARADDLIARHGAPDVMKIDVEGSEADVLRGLSVAPGFVYFEFHCAHLEPTLESFDCLRRLGRYVYNYSVSQQQAWQLERWIDAPQLVTRLESLAHREPKAYGDVFASRVDAA